MSGSNAEHRQSFPDRLGLQGLKFGIISGNVGGLLGKSLRAVSFLVLYDKSWIVDFRTLDTSLEYRLANISGVPMKRSKATNCNEMNRQK